MSSVVFFEDGAAMSGRIYTWAMLREAPSVLNTVWMDSQGLTTMMRSLYGSITTTQHRLPTATQHIVTGLVFVDRSELRLSKTARQLLLRLSQLPMDNLHALCTAQPMPKMELSVTKPRWSKLVSWRVPEQKSTVTASPMINSPTSSRLPPRLVMTGF